MRDKEIKILQPATTRVVINEMALNLAMYNNVLSEQEIQKISELLHADAVIIGEVNSYKNGLTLNGFAPAKLVDSKTGEIIAASHRASGLLFGYSEHQCVVAAVENVTKDIANVVNEISK